MIAIVNYGSGNIDALCTIYKKTGVPFCVAARAEDLTGVDRILLPGVGAFDQAIGELERSGLRHALQYAVCERHTPILGICVGMQLLAESSEEGTCKGLGWIPGVVRKFDRNKLGQANRLPHMGWNSVNWAPKTTLFSGINQDTEFYFLHSYHFCCTDSADELATTNYGGAFSSAIQRGHITGVQFHPEKSHQSGVTLLRNFATQTA